MGSGIWRTAGNVLLITSPIPLPTATLSLRGLCFTVRSPSCPVFFCYPVRSSRPTVDAEGTQHAGLNCNRETHGTPVTPHPSTEQASCSICSHLYLFVACRYP